MDDCHLFAAGRPAGNQSRERAVSTGRRSPASAVLMMVMSMSGSDSTPALPESFFRSRGILCLR